MICLVTGTLLVPTRSRDIVVEGGCQWGKHEKQEPDSNQKTASRVGFVLNVLNLSHCVPPLRPMLVEYGSPLGGLPLLMTIT
jgi:hypothetical protein